MNAHVLIVLVCVAAVANVAPAALVAHYTFNNNTPGMLIDSSGNGFNATIGEGGPGSTAGRTPF